MADRFRSGASRGFTMIELLVAMLFTLLLMAGMATVFKSSLNYFHGSGEKISSLRRNRMAVDLLKDDLNNAGMYLTDLSTPPSTVAGNPPFSIKPNVTVADSADPTDPTSVDIVADELFFFMDEPLPFEGVLNVPVTAPAKSAAELVLAGTAPAVTDNKYTIDCKDHTYATQVAAGQSFIFKDSFEPVYIVSVDPVGASDKTVSVTIGANPSAAVTGRGYAGGPVKSKHLDLSGLVVLREAQMVRYRVIMLQLDPDPLHPKGVPCLVREQGPYSGSFTASKTDIITENVSGFKVYLSADSGQNWVGGSNANTGVPNASNQWSDIRTALDTQLASSNAGKSVGRTNFTTTEQDEHWFRSIPVLTRVDVTTRTAAKRSEYSKTPKTKISYKEETRSLVFVPRHFGLSMK